MSQGSKDDSWITPEKVQAYKSVWNQVWNEMSEPPREVSQEQLQQHKKEAEKKKRAEALALKAAKEEERRKLEDIGFQLKKLSLKEGDVVIIHLTCNPKPGLATLVQQLLDMAPVKKLKLSVLVLPKEINLETVSEKDMNKEGWYKRGHRLVRPDV